MAQPPAAYHGDVATKLVLLGILEMPLLAPLRWDRPFSLWPDLRPFWLQKAMAADPIRGVLVAVAIGLTALFLHVRGRRFRTSDRGGLGWITPVYGTLVLVSYTFYCPALMQEVEALVERGISHLILDMRLVKFINSTALSAVIKAHKRCRAEGGDLVISQPSSFVRDIMGKVGIDKLVTLHDSEQDAVKAIIKHLNQKELVAEASVDHEKVLITFTDDIRNKMIGGKKALVGKMANVDGHKVQFLWNGTKAGISADQGKQLFFAGSDVQLKFQVKMIKKSFF